MLVNREVPPERNAGLVRLTGLMLAATFAVVGVVFLAIPTKVLEAFNWLAARIGLPRSPTTGYGFYLALGVAYMYVVTLLAWQMARRPQGGVYARLLVHAKAASSALSLGLFLLQQQYLIYLANFLVDGAIALGVWVVCVRAGGAPASAPREPLV